MVCFSCLFSVVKVLIFCFDVLVCVLGVSWVNCFKGKDFESGFCGWNVLFVCFFCKVLFVDLEDVVIGIVGVGLSLLFILFNFFFIFLGIF